MKKTNEPKILPKKEERRAKSHFRVTIKRGKFNLASKRGVPPRKTLSKQNLLIRGVPAEYIEGTFRGLCTG